MAESVRRVRPTPSDKFLANPHKGCCTFQHFNGDELFAGKMWSEIGPKEFPKRKYVGVTPGYLPSTVSYCRWFWRDLEPEQGRYDFARIEQALDVCKERGQTLALRLMSFGTGPEPRLPEWFVRRGKGIKIDTLENGVHACVDTLPIPVYDSPEFYDAWGGFIREFARRFDANPLLETVDLSYLGPGGEGYGECTLETCRRFSELFRDAFVHTPRLSQICGIQGKPGIDTGAGWRADSFGDLGDIGSPYVLKTNSWNHHFDYYPESIAKAGAQDAWKHAPVHYESSWVPMQWYEERYDLDFILKQGLKDHVTYFMPKYCRLPEPWLERLAEFCRNIGYRHVYRQALYSTNVKPGAEIKFHSWIENVGVAPLYRKYDFVLRLRQGDREEKIALPEVDVRKWLPGDTILDTKFKLPAAFKPGWVDLAVGLVQPVTGEARVSFASKEAFSDRWLSLGGIDVAE